MIRIQCYNQNPGLYSSLLAGSFGKQSPVDQDPVNQNPGLYSSLLAGSFGKQSPVDQDPVL